MRARLSGFLGKAESVEDNGLRVETSYSHRSRNTLNPKPQKPNTPLISKGLSQNPVCRGEVRAARFSPDGKMVLTGGTQLRENNIRALIIRIGFWNPLYYNYYNYHKEPPRQLLRPPISCFYIQCPATSRFS